MSGTTKNNTRAMWTTVHREISPWDAHIVAGLLQAEGVPAFVLFDNIMRISWSSSLAYGMVLIQVPSEQTDAARAVLQAWRQGEYDAALSAELSLPGDVRCPRCAGYRWRPVRDGWVGAMTVFFWGFGFVFPPPLTGRRCGACGLRQTLAEMDEGTPA